MTYMDVLKRVIVWCEIINNYISSYLREKCKHFRVIPVILIKYKRMVPCTALLRLPFFFIKINDIYDILKRIIYNNESEDIYEIK